MTRRTALGGLAMLGTQACFAASGEWATIAAIEKAYDGRLGLYAVDTGSGQTVAYRADERFTMCSTFKVLLAALVLTRVEAGKESLSRIVRFGPHDLAAAGYPDYACPITAQNVQVGSLTIGTLCRSIVEASDNLGAILLMRSVGGPVGLTTFLRRLGDTVTRSDRYEPASNDYSGMLDTTTPRAMAASFQKILLGPTLSLESRGLLESWMVDARSGLKRLRAASPADWQVADKTGTSGAEETNDVALIRRPGRTPLVIAAYYDAPHNDLDRREMVLRRVGTAVMAWAHSI